MQSIKIDIYISDLLYQYDCVVIPDFGGFVANYASAKINEVQHKITPPSKSISFNKNLKNNDGLLGNHIATRRSISYEEANELIQSFVNQSIDGLRKGDKIEIEKVGTLHLDAENNIQFIAEEKNNYLLDSYGLGTLRVQPIKRQSIEEKVEEKVIPIVREQQKRRRYLPVAALLLVFFASTIFLNRQFGWLDASQINYSKIGINNSEEKHFNERRTKYISPEIEEEENELGEELEEGIIPYLISETEKTSLFIDNRREESKSKIDNTSVAASLISRKLKFHVMGGCFSKLSNAENLVSNLKDQGFEARLLGTYKDLFAVSFGSFATREEAIRLLVAVKQNENSAAWLLVKPY